MKTLDIQLPDGKVTVKPVPRAKLPQLEKLMIELQSYWIAEEFSTGDAIASDEAWDLIRRVWALLPLANEQGVLNPDDLEKLDSDYEQLERLFFGDARSAYDGKLSDFDLTQFQGCAVWELHRVDARKKLMLAEQARTLRREKPQNEPSPPPMSQSPAVETAPPTPSLTSSTASEKPASPYSSDSMPTPSTG